MAIVIDTNICQGVEACPKHGICIEICALNALDNVDGRPVVNEAACPECELCRISCPLGAISKP